MTSINNISKSFTSILSNLNIFHIFEWKFQKNFFMAYSSLKQPIVFYSRPDDLYLTKKKLSNTIWVYCSKYFISFKKLKNNTDYEIPVFLIFDMVVQNKKSGISSLYLA